MITKRPVSIMLIAIVIILIGAAGCFEQANQSGLSGDNSTPVSIKNSIPPPAPGPTENITFPKVEEGFLLAKLFDAFTGQTIRNVDVRIFSNNGISCFKAPCPTAAQEWNGKSDNDGLVLIPLKVINVYILITATGYKSGRDLNRDSEKIISNYWLIELDPDTKIDNFERRLKLIDSKTLKPLAGATLWITSNENCRPPQCSDFTFTGTTNTLGNIYYPISSIKDGNIYYPSPIKDNSWVFVNNYGPAQFPTGWVNYKVLMERE
jgi:hypothetical protein